MGDILNEFINNSRFQGMKGYIVLSTFPSSIDAKNCGIRVLKKKLVACVNILPVLQSLYFWEGKLEQSEEVLCIFKTMEHHFSELEKEILAVHSYKTPEIVGFPIQKCTPDFLEWLKKSTSVG